MHASNKVPYLLQRFNGFSRAIENHICRVEVDEQIFTFGITNKGQQTIGSFLPSFQVNALVVAQRMLAQAARDFNHFLIECTSRIVRVKA